MLIGLFAAVFLITYAFENNKDKDKTPENTENYAAEIPGDNTELSTDSPQNATQNGVQNNQNVGGGVVNPQNPTTGASGGVITQAPLTASSTGTTLANSTSAGSTAPGQEQQRPSSNGNVIPYPLDEASWQLICLNKNRVVEKGYESKMSLSYVAGSNQRMDSRAAVWYDKMYNAALADGITLTPCSGYRSYDRQDTLFNEYVNDYMSQGYGYQEAYDKASTRRNPPGSSEHNIGICMDIICAASSAGFENTSAYRWLKNNAANYGFIERYPQNKQSATGVKFEPWHWRYVGVGNAPAIASSGLCLEEYLGLV